MDGRTLPVFFDVVQQRRNSFEKLRATSLRNAANEGHVAALRGHLRIHLKSREQRTVKQITLSRKKLFSGQIGRTRKQINACMS